MIPIIIFCYCLRYQTSQQIMEEDIPNYSQIFMFHGTP